MKNFTLSVVREKLKNVRPIFGLASVGQTFVLPSKIIICRPANTVCSLQLLRACCHQRINNLLRADDIRLVGTTCCELAYQPCYKMITTCSRLRTSSANSRTQFVDKL
jgi:hypothetical protein